MTKLRVTIAGAGIGGLTAGVALAQAGHQVDIYEQAPVLAEVGAGISLSQAVQSAYRWLGLFDRIAAVSNVTADIAFLHHRTGHLLAGTVDHGDGSGDPSSALAVLQLHRADLHTILTDEFRRLAPAGLHLGCPVTAAEPGSSSSRLWLADGALIESDLVIGADGLRSGVRRSLHGDIPARFTNQVAYRFLMNSAEASPHLQFGRAAVFQGPARVFNRYTIRRGAVLNCVAVARTDDWQAEGWSIPGNRAELLALYDGWHPEVLSLMERADGLIKWGIFDRPALSRWSEGGVTLLGDAAHPMLPFLGLGAAMAIEDAVVLARSLEVESSISEALRRYETARKPRTAVVHEQSRRQCEIVQASNPDRFDVSGAPSHDPAYYSYDPVTASI